MCGSQTNVSMVFSSNDLRIELSVPSHMALVVLWCPDSIGCTCFVGGRPGTAPCTVTAMFSMLAGNGRVATRQTLMTLLKIPTQISWRWPKVMVGRRPVLLISLTKPSVCLLEEYSTRTGPLGSRSFGIIWNLCECPKPSNQWDVRYVPRGVSSTVYWPGPVR